MAGSTRRLRLFTGVALSTFVLALGTGGSAKAEATDAQIKALQAQVEVLMRTVKELKDAQTHTAAEAKAARKQAHEADANSAQAKATAEDARRRSKKAPVQTGWLDRDGHSYFQHKDGNALTFFTPNGEITAYGQFDVSADASTKNAGSLELNGSSAPVGNFGWLPALSTNSSYLGVRGFQRLGDRPTHFIYQLELGMGITSTPGLKQSNSNLSDTTDGTLFNRNTWIGFADPAWGAIKVGKSSSPYETSTGRFNPFGGEIGTYGSIMGNSGGDNRVEFGTRIDHAIWYESPKFAGGFDFKFMFAPGQNRADNSDNIAAGESDCAGGNDPTSGGNPLVSCSDGAFSNVVSTSLSYTHGPFYMTAAYEFHQKVNRSSDIAGAYGLPPVFGPQDCSAMPTALGVQLCNEDTANEDAAKIAAMYKFSTGTTVGGIVERLHRYVPADLDFQNERSRWGTWLVVDQQLSPADSVHFGWGHAFRSPGNPGQHNDSTLMTADGASYGPTENQADMITAAYKHKYTENLTWYTAVAATFNGPDAHYDLGAGGHGITTDCHDASNASGGLVSGPHCYTGTTIVGVSTGMQWKF
jgi:predicted porin